MSRPFVSKHSAELKNSNKLSNPDLLVKNLRLLDLDEDFDWPGIDNSTFDTRDNAENSVRRLYCAAWVFYKLFELYDGKETKRNLGDLFPPIGTEQSSLLRNAIFKWLYKLKVAGFFGKEVVVRKPMFDDCKGSKFEELLAVFSSAVLIRVVGQASQTKCVVQRSIGLTVCPLGIQSLILAYQASLSKHLRTRAILEKRWHKFSRALQSQNDLLEQRSQCVESRSVSKRFPQRTLANLHTFVRKQWSGDPKWVDVLLRSDQHHSTGSMMDLSFTDVWSHACNDTLYAIRPQQKESCVQSLESRLKEQKARLDRWKTTQVILAARKEKSYPLDRTHAAYKEELPVRKYSLRSYGAPSSIIPPASTSNSRKVSVTADDSYLPRGIGQREARHRGSKSISGLTLGDVPISTTPFATQKPVANTGVRLSSTAQLLSSQDHPQSFSMRPITSQQSLENTPTQRPSDESTIFGNNDKTTIEATTYDPYANLSAYTPSLSLAERTKLSMTKRADNSTMPLAHDTFSSTESTPGPSAVTLGDLAHRTRQSMLTKQTRVIGPPSRIERKARTSFTHPTNQFESRKTGIAADDSFFDETTIDLDEVDIFKSRPRVAVSPVLTPMTEAAPLPTITADDSYEDDFS